MGNAKEGWFPDPSNKHRARWWSGEVWTDHVSQRGKVWQSPLAVASPGRRLRWLFWALVALGIILLITAPAFVFLVALAALITAIIGLVKDRRTWLRLGSRRSAVVAIAAASALLVVAGSVNAAQRPNSEISNLLAADIPAVDRDAPAPAPSTERATPKPKPSPLRTTTEEVVTESIAFESSTIDDATLPAGESVVSVPGVAGVKTYTYRVTWEGNTEVDRELISEVITTPPTTEITANGTYVAPPPPPPPPPPPAAPSGCDPNYADACVPIASDVDCAWGSGNGPAYLDGVARVVGSDVYGLDRDGDGYACERD